MHGSRLRVALTALLVVAASAPALARAPVTIGIVFHVARIDGHAVADDAFIDSRLERANQAYAPYDVAFVKLKTLPLATEHAVLESRADRDALGALVGRGVIDMRRGVHWHSSAHPGAHYVIVSATRGGPLVLAHELGHYLGNPKHSETPGNLMNPDGMGAHPELDAAQKRNLERALRGYLARHELQQVRALARR